MSASLLICRQQFASNWAHNAAMPDIRHMDRAPVDDGHVEYLLHGSGDPMLFIHGAGIADAFVAADEPAAFGTSPEIHYRRRGYGQSTAAGGPPESFMARAAADAAQLLAHLRVDAAHVVGHSSGALLGVPSTGPHMAALTPAVQRYAAGDRAGAIDGLFSVVFGPGWRPHADLAVPGGAEQAEAEAARSSSPSCLASERGSSMRAEQHRSGSLCSS